MATPHVLILNSGGLRSLVATALARAEATKTRLTLLYVLDGRDNPVGRLHHAHRQAEHFGVGQVTELDLPHVLGHGYGRLPDGRPMGPLASPQVLLAAVAQARLLQAERVTWPTSFNVEPHAMARATEQVVLLDHLAQLEGVPMPRLEAPLLELTDQQVIELGGQLGVPWELAWSCLLAGERPCRVCLACRRRKQAFEKAGMVDPIEKSTPGRG